MTTSALFGRTFRMSRRCLSTALTMMILFSTSADLALASIRANDVRFRTSTLALADAVDESTVFEGFNIPTSTQRLSAIKTYTVDATAYTSSVEECDSDPFITADGSRTRDGIIATNILPFNTKVRIPELFGDKIFEVHDRMNARYSYRIDVWMEKKTDMRQFGIHHRVKLEVIEMGDGKTQWKKLAKTK